MKEPKYYYDLEQGTDKWLEARLGIVTASEAKKLLTAKYAIADNKTSNDYARHKAGERITKRIEHMAESYDMMRGTLQEPIARDIYSENYAAVKECGFITREFDGVTIGASPDGLVGDVGMVEIKSRKAKFQIETINSDTIPAEYIVQIQVGLLVSGRKWCDFIQYSNGMKFYVKRVESDLSMQSTILTACKSFEMNVSDMVDEFSSKSETLIDTEWIDLDFDDDMEVGDE